MRGVIALCAAAFVMSGCGYALKGRGNTLPTNIRRIGVPTFQNHSNTADLDRILTEAVRQELLGRGKFVVVQDTTGVDAVLTGTVNPIRFDVATLTTSRQAQRYLITVSASLEFKAVKDNEVLWSNQSMRVTDEYDVTGTAGANDPAALFSQDQNALSRLAKSFARSVVTSMLDRF